MWRPNSVARQIQEILSELVHKRLKDPRLGFVTLTGVDMTQDLRTARVYVSVMGDATAREETLNALTHASAYLRRELGGRIRLRHIPELLFVYDASIERGARINRLLDSLE